MQAMVRIELHHGTKAVYQVLHFSMAGAGFSRILKSGRTGKTQLYAHRYLLDRTVS